MSNSQNIQPPSREQIMKIALPLLGPNGPFTIGMNEKGRYFVKAQKNMVEYYSSNFNQYLNNTFIVFNKERYSYRKVWDISKKIGNILSTNYGINNGDRVAIAMRNYPEWCLSFIGIGCIGGVPVPINSFWKGNEMKYGLNDSGCKILFCDPTRYKFIESHLDSLNIKVIVTRSSSKNIKLHNKAIYYEDFINENCSPKSDHQLNEFASNNIKEDDPAVIMYTSGTTGHPKGVVMTHRGILNQMEVVKFMTTVRDKLSLLPGFPPQPPKPEQEGILCVVPLFHGTGSHHCFLQSIITGRKFVIMYKWDPKTALEIIEREKLTAWTGVPTMSLDVMEHPDFNKYDTSSLLSIGTGGAHTPASQVLRTAKSFKNGMPSSAYGLTETNGAICLNSDLNYIRKPTSCGTPFPIVEVKIVDVDTGETLGPNERGELLIKSNLNMKEYWNKPEATAKVFTKDNFFKSGDIATIDEEGFIYIVDRAKDIIIRGGENISCSEVENAIYRHSAVRECAVFGIPDKRLGEVVGALILLKSKVSKEDIVSSLKGNIADYKIPLPHNIFFTDKPLPRGATGKIIKRTIKENILGANNIQSKL